MNLDDRKVRKTWRDKIAMRRIGDPEDVVGAVAFFASDDAAFITGPDAECRGRDRVELEPGTDGALHHDAA